jgi:hypothetical protein
MIFLLFSLLLSFTFRQLFSQLSIGFVTQTADFDRFCCCRFLRYCSRFERVAADALPLVDF